jgi:sterol desaturase/sphingolipid hydroxylase (fatty acid hydroxylase superfamily)
MNTINHLRWATGPLLLVLLLGWESLAPYLSLFQRGWLDRVSHGLRNLALALLNSALTAVLFAGLWSGAAQVADQRSLGLSNWMGLAGWPHALAAILLVDLWTYSWHRMNHRVPFLWRFHRTHHSDAQMDVTTASRFHLGEIMFSNSLRVPVIVLVGARLWELALYEILLLAVIQFHHANIGLPKSVDRILRYVLVTPAMHKVHHSRWPPETDSNYSSLLSVWDRLFGSFQQRDTPRPMPYGLDGFDAREHQTFIGILKTPAVAHPSRQTDTPKSPATLGR